MNCREFRELMEREGTPAPGDALQAHAASCAACARLRDDAVLVDGSLACLRENDAAEEAPPELEIRLLAEFRGRRTAAEATSYRSAFRPAWPWLAAASAAVALAAVLTFRLSRQTPQEPGVTPSAPPVADVRGAPRPEARPSVPDRVLQPPPPAAAGAVDAARRQVRHRLRMAEGTEFFLTLQTAADEPGTELQLVRVPVSRQTLEGFGLSLDPRAADRPIKADLLIGPDGLTRAVRFISERE